MKNIKIGFKLICGFLVVSLIALAMGLYNLQAMNSLNENINVLGGVTLPVTANVGVIDAEINNIRAIVRTVINESLPEDARKRQAETLVTARARYAAAMHEVEIAKISTENKAKLADLKRALVEWRASNDECFKYVDGKEFQKAGDLALGFNRTVTQNAVDAANALITSVHRDSEQLVQEANSASKRVTVWSTVLMISGFVVSICLGVLLTRGITGPLNKAVAMADGLARGDLSVRMSMERRDEIGMLSRSLDSLADTFSKLNANIVTMAGKAASGYLRSTISDAGFSGDYKTLIASINRWTGSMLMLIDKIPSPIMIRDAARTMRFLNAAGSLGVVDFEKLNGLKCDAHFKTEDCVNGTCGCDAAFTSQKEESSSTVARPLPDVVLDVEYKAIPFGDDAVFEFVTDLSEIMKVQRKVVEIATQAEDVATNVASASEEISAQVEQCTRGAQDQSSRLGETATAMEQMNATVVEVAKNASQAADTAEVARQKAEDGASIVEQVVKGIAEVQKRALELKTNMSALGQQAQSIGHVMNVINDIADQTNLLALNAAIEAARAGDAGRGFAVVADEVRKLAEKTMAATKEVGAAISDIQNGTRLNISNVEQTVATVEGATALATKSGESLGEIVILVDKTTDQIRSIASASEQQSAASEEIHRSIEEINRISTETSDAMRQSALAVNELAGQSQALSSLIEDMQSSGGPKPVARVSSRPAALNRLALN